eukprot:TRINITY_DN2194_c0_g2_i1.p1 TRINITY_DN2194_c0_g2~~TRINITY_DN2194_c0_g2_i1.p1  ORF type:complete len:585 (-),score=65.86 TRINITY_DN2194_c0_g2_i1:145-1899(-)
MYKNQLQELAQRSCFNLPSYACIREGPDHAPRFKATVNFNGEIFESPSFCTTLRQAEHAAAEVALNTLSRRGPSRSLAAKVLDETGVYKNLLQETAHRAGLNLPVYTTIRSGPGHVPVFSCTVELAGMTFTGDPARTKKQAQKNAAMAAWSALKQLPHLASSSSSSSSSPLLGSESNDEQEQVIIARALANLNSTDGNKPLAHNDRHRGRRKPAYVRRDTNQASGLTLYPMPYQSWPYSNFSPEVAMYQMWQQEQASRQQSQLLTLPAPPPPPPGPRIFPFIHSIFRANHNQYFPAREREPSPSLYFSDHSVPNPVRSGSRVTIQEIHEEKSQGEDKVWLRGCVSDADGDSRFKAQNPPVSVSHIEPEVMESHEDKQKDYGSSTTINMSTDREQSIGHSVKPVTSGSCPSMVQIPCNERKIQENQKDGNQREQFEWVRGGSNRDPGFRPRASNPSHIQFQTHNPRFFEPSQSNLRPPHHPPKTGSFGMPKCFRPPSLAAPVTIRTSVPVCSARPRAEGLNPAVTSNNFMAPAVQIRSVIPVCSAPPVREIPNLSHEKSFSGVETRSQEREDIAAANSELGKLRI